MPPCFVYLNIYPIPVFVGMTAEEATLDTFESEGYQATVRRTDYRRQQGNLGVSRLVAL